MKLQDLLQGLAPLEFHADTRRRRSPASPMTPAPYSPAISSWPSPASTPTATSISPMALERGATAVLCEKAPEAGSYVRVADTRLGLAQVGANWYGHPARQMTMIGVTGTNGKTTTTYLVKHILEDCLGPRWAWWAPFRT